MRRSAPAARWEHTAKKRAAGQIGLRVYNRLKQRKNRGKVSADEWNVAVARAVEVLEQAGRGELTDDEMRRRFAEF